MRTVRKKEMKQMKKERIKKKGKGDKREGDKTEVCNVGFSEMEILGIFKSGHLNPHLRT